MKFTKELVTPGKFCSRGAHFHYSEEGIPRPSVSSIRERLMRDLPHMTIVILFPCGFHVFARQNNTAFLFLSLGKPLFYREKSLI